jgi:hypothetical protein
MSHIYKTFIVPLLFALPSQERNITEGDRLINIEFIPINDRTVKHSTASFLLAEMCMTFS